MGKTTLGRFLEQAADNLTLSKPVKVTFTRVSYDRIFSEFQS